MTLFSSLRTLLSVGFDLKRLFDRPRASAPGEDDPETRALLARAGEVSAAGRHQEAGTLYRQILQTRKSHLGALRGLRDLAAAAGRWAEALELQQRIAGAVAPAERSPEIEWLAGVEGECRV